MGSFWIGTDEIVELTKRLESHLSALDKIIERSNQGKEQEASILTMLNSFKNLYFVTEIVILPHHRPI